MSISITSLQVLRIDPTRQILITCILSSSLRRKTSFELRNRARVRISRSDQFEFLLALLLIIYVSCSLISRFKRNGKRLTLDLTILFLREPIQIATTFFLHFFSLG